jgi:uncharacterized protein (DUF983 family)
MAEPSVLAAGLGCKCPNCGQTPVFRKFITFRDRCEACGADFSISDTGDGAAFFVMFAALILIVPTAMFTELAFSPPGWVHIVLWPPITFGFCLLCLRPVKATLFALQWRHKAGEARLDPPPSPPAA